MKKCNRCKTEKNESEFGKNKNQKDGLWCYCKTCVSELGKIERAKRPEFFREKSKKYREENPEKFKESCRKTYLKYQNEKIKLQRKYYWENREEIRKKESERNKTPEARLKKKKYREKNIEKITIQTQCHKMILYAVKLGVINKPNKCENCLIECIPEGHHKDYSKPLDVIWVCRKCHRKLEKKEN